MQRQRNGYVSVKTFVGFMPYIYINWNYIERVSQAKVVGVTVASDFNWNALVDDIVSKTRKKYINVRALNLLRNLCSMIISIRCFTLVRKYDIV